MHDNVETVTLATEKDGETSTKAMVSKRVHEQRWSHLLHALGILVCVSSPLMHVLGLTPTSVLAGLFLFMGEQSLAVNPILWRIFHLLTPSNTLPKLSEDGAFTYWAIHAYTGLQLALTAGIFATTLTVAGPVFPIIIILLVPVRLMLMNRIWSRECLRHVDTWACRDGAPEDEKIVDGSLG
jgi:hypothetical protein